MKKKILKFIAYSFLSFFIFLVVFFAGITIYDSYRWHLVESKIYELKIGDTKTKVLHLLGKGQGTWKKGEKTGLGLFGIHFSYQDDVIAYGKIVDWSDPFFSEFPYFFPFRIRLFGPDENDFIIHFDEKGLINKVEIPKLTLQS